MKWSLAILCLCFLSAISAFCADYYVSTAGSDGNPGTQAQPFATIQHAINVASGTTTVHLDASTWNESPTADNKSITIIGDYNGPHGSGGRNVSIVNGTISMSVESGIVSCGINSLTVKHIFLGNLELSPALNITITNCDVSNPSGQGIQLNAAYPSSFTVNNCSIHDCNGMGINCIGGTINDCLIFNNNGDGIQHQSIQATTCNIHNNSIYNNNGNGVTATVQVEAMQHNYINDNIIHNNSHNGIYVTGIGSDCAVTANNNQTYSNQLSGININVDKLNSCSGNHCCDNGEYGFYCTDYLNCSISGNYFGSDGVRGGNQLAGLNILTGLTGTFTLNDNSINANSTYGIQFRDCKLKVYNNTIQSNQSYGVHFTGTNCNPDLGGGAQSSPGNNIISGNGTYEAYNASPNNIYAKYNHWDAQSEQQMAGGYYNTVNVTRIWDKWEDSSKGYVIWSDPYPSKVTAPSLGILKAAFYTSSNTVGQAKKR